MKIGALSGSITKTNDGSSYLVAGTNVTITSASNGSVTIDSTGGSPGGSINEIQYNGSGVFTGSINFTFDGTNACLTGSFSQGSNSLTLGINSHAEGNTTLAVGNESHSEGSGTTAGFLGYLSNDISLSEQDKIYLDASYGNVVASFSGGQTAIIHDSLYDDSIKYLTAYVNGVSWNGTNTVLDFTGVVTIPNTTTAVIGVVGIPTPSGADQIMGQASHAEGGGTLTIGYYSHAEGLSTISSGQYSHAEGDATVASGEYSHAEGGSGGGGLLVASGDYSHAEGYNTTASGVSSHAEGGGTTAIGQYSHTEGQNTIALGDYSHAEGRGTIASGSYQHVGGNYNLRNNDYSLYVVGNGTGDDDSLRSDILRVNTDSVQITGSIVQSNSGSSTIGFMGNQVGSSPSSIGSDVFFYVSGSIGSDVAAFGGDLVVSGTILLEGDTLEVTGTISATQGFSGSLTTLVDGTSYLIAGTNITITSASNGSVTIDATATSPGGSDTEIQYNSGGSFAGSSNFTYNGSSVFLTGSFSQGFQTTASGIDSHSEGRATTASGDYSHAEGGTGITASGYASHAEGEGAIASGTAAHAEGQNTLAQGNHSHAEGLNAISMGNASHAEGESTIAVGAYSHAEGQGTIASGSHQHVGGNYNKRNNDFSLLVVGNGTSDIDDDRSDIFRVNTDSVQVSGSLIVSGAYIHNVVSGTTAPNYTVGTWDHVIVFSNNVVTATLPSAAPIGRKLIFKDGTGAASTAGGQMLSCSLGAIDGSSTYTMASVNYTAVSVIKINDPDEWIIV